MNTETDVTNQFPNYFVEIAKSLVQEGLVTDEHAAKDKVLRIIEKNIGAILRQLYIPSVVDNDGQAIPNNFFAALEKELQEIVAVWNQEHPNEPEVNLQLYLGSAVTRAILAYIYKKLHIALQEQHRITASQAISVCDSVESEAFDRGSIAHFMRESMKNPEYHLKRAAMTKDYEIMHHLLVLGVGSEIDLHYQLDGDPNPELKARLELAAREFLNKIQAKLDSELEEVPSSVSFAERSTYLKSSTLTGGATTDWMAYRLGKSSQLDAPMDGINILHEFIDGLYRYIESEANSEKQQLIIKALSSLLQLPFISIKNVEQVRQHLEQINFDELSDEEYEQVQMLVKSACLSAANNRHYREAAGILALMAAKNLVPQFVERKPIEASRDISGDNQELVTEHLLSVEGFLSAFCTKVGQNYEVYHGTNSLVAMLHILRGGFFTSNGELGQGLSALGTGLYTTPDKAIAKAHAEEYGSASHTFCFRIKDNPNLRVLNYDVLEDEQKKILELEAEKLGYHDVNQLLFNEYKIDIIINQHVIVQNLAVFEDVSLRRVLQDFRDDILSELSSEAIFSKFDEWKTTSLIEVVSQLAIDVSSVMDAFALIGRAELGAEQKFVADLQTAIQKLLMGYMLHGTADMDKYTTAYIVLKELERYGIADKDTGSKVVAHIESNFSKNGVEFSEEAFIRAITACVRSGFINAYDETMFELVLQKHPQKISKSGHDKVIALIDLDGQSVENLEWKQKLKARMAQIVDQKTPPPPPRRKRGYSSSTHS